MKKFITALAALTVIATPTFAQSLDPAVGNGYIFGGGGTIALRQATLKLSVSAPKSTVTKMSAPLAIMRPTAAAAASYSQSR